ncbi:hypothetical protein GCM10027185_53130 [Spirosoma pulveris]
MFGYTRDDLKKALSYTSVVDFVDKELLADRPQPEAPDSWVTETPISNNGTVDSARYTELTNWWFTQTLNEGVSMREKMVLFWHNHFVSDRDKVSYPQHMYQQNALFRKYAFGDFRQFTKEVTINPAMLIYLDGRQNNKNAPNENYARELLELFTLGIGNYTETDIKQAALALTGWSVNGLNAVFSKNNFASQNKTFLGKTGNFTYGDIVDIILTKDAAAEFICRKLYKEFVFYKSNESFVRQMAAVFRTSNYSIRSVLQFMLTSDEFFKPDYRGSKIKNPIELAVGTLKFLDITNPDFTYVADTSRTLQQYMFFPPNVAGWPGQRNWISSTTYLARSSYSDSVVNGRKSNGQNLTFRVVPLDYARSYQSAENATLFVKDVVSGLLQLAPNPTKEKLLLDTLLDGTIAANWSTNTPMADVRIQKFLKALMRLPEYQLT